MFDVKSRAFEGGTVLEASGRLRAGDPVELLMDAAQSAVAGGDKLVLIDMQDVGYIDSIGIETLLEIHKKLIAASGRLMLCGLRKNVDELMQITRLSTVFEIHPDEATALKSLET